MNVLAAGHETIGNPVANIAIFGVFVLITLYVVIRASQRNATATEFFTADRAFSGPQNGRPDRSAVVTFAGPVSS